MLQSSITPVISVLNVHVFIKQIHLVFQNHTCFEGVLDYKSRILTVRVAAICTFWNLSIILLPEKEWKQILHRYSGTSHYMLKYSQSDQSKVTAFTLCCKIDS